MYEIFKKWLRLRKNADIPGILVFWQRKDLNFSWRMRGANGEIVCGAEGYTTKHDAQRGAELAKYLFSHPHLQILDITAIPEDFAAEESYVDLPNRGQNG